MNEENETMEPAEQDTTRTSIEYLAAEARFVYLRDIVDSSLAEGHTAEEAFMPYDELPEAAKEGWRRVASHLEKLVLLRIKPTNADAE